jgi:hypothetical protein
MAWHRIGLRLLIEEGAFNQITDDMIGDPVKLLDCIGGIGGSDDADIARWWHIAALTKSV